MSIIRAPRKESNYYILDKKISEDKRLSWAARGLLVFLLGKPDHWTVNVQALINETKASKKSTGRDGVWNLLKELIEVGYCTRLQTRKEDGTLGEMSYTISEDCAKPRTDFQSTAPRTDSPCTARPFTANPPLVSTDVLARTDSEQGLKGGERAQAPATPTFPKLDDDFAEQAQDQAAQAEADRLAADQAAAEAARLAAEQKAAAAAQEAAQEAAKNKTKATAPAKAEKPAKAAKSAPSLATDFPADFEPNATCIELATELGVTLGGIDGELARFEDYHAAQGTKFKDWQAGLRTWIRNAAKFAKRDQAVAAAKAAPAAETAYQRSMRERVQEFAPSIARKAPDAPKAQSAADFFNAIEVPARTVGALK
jgi:hypothetical protein